MNSTALPAAAAILAATLCSCAATSPQTSVDLNDNYRFAGSMRGVRVDAQLVGHRGGFPFTVVYEIRNGRDQAIAIVPAASVASYDERARTITLRIGAEIPASEEMTVERIRPGERRTFTTTARVADPGFPHARLRAVAQFVRVRLTYLRQLDGLGMDGQALQQSAVRVTEATLPAWLERNESLITNALPLDPVARRSGPTAERATSSGARPVGRSGSFH